MKLNEPIRIAGVDEAGVGPLAGPVVAAAVILDCHYEIEGLADSKILTEKRREELFLIIQEKAFAWSVGLADVEEIDRLNILQANLLAMQRAIEALPTLPDRVLIDGKHKPKNLNCRVVRTIIGGDQTVPAISAASIMAKVTRDRMMKELDICYPGYDFAIHKGYPTKKHILKLMQLGVSPIHRRSFAPVRRLLPFNEDVCQG